MDRLHPVTHLCQTYQNKAIDHPTSDVQLICKCKGELKTTKPHVKKTLSDEHKTKMYTITIITTNNKNSTITFYPTSFDKTFL